MTSFTILPHSVVNSLGDRRVQGGSVSVGGPLCCNEGGELPVQGAVLQCRGWS